jgi:hypothetical protein
MTPATRRARAAPCWIAALALASTACAVIAGPPPEDPPPAPALESHPVAGGEGPNCATRSLPGPDGTAPAFPSLVAYYYRTLSATTANAGAAKAIEVRAPDADAWSRPWRAKSAQILAGPGQRAYADGNGYDGVWGLASAAGDRPCASVLDERARLRGMLAHVALTTDAVCATDAGGAQRFWQVDGIGLLRIGEAVDSEALITAGFAERVGGAASDRCVVPAQGDQAGPGPGPCQVALRADVVIEAVLLPVPTPAAIGEVPLLYRAFAAVGTAPLPERLRAVRTLLRSPAMRVMDLVEQPIFSRLPERGPGWVKLAGHHVGPVKRKSRLLSADERDWLDLFVHKYGPSCCHATCTAPPDGSAPVCTTTCLPEGACPTNTLDEQNTFGQGLIVMVSDRTTATCPAACPAPTDAPATAAPTCAP